MGVNSQTDIRQSCKAPVVQFPSFPRQYPEIKESSHEDFTPALFFVTVGNKKIETRSIGKAHMMGLNNGEKKNFQALLHIRIK